MVEELKIITSSSANGLNSIISKYIEDGWKPKGSHHVVQDYSLYQYRGNQIGGIKHDLEYSITMIKGNDQEEIHSGTN